MCSGLSANFTVRPPGRHFYQPFCLKISHLWIMVRFLLIFLQQSNDDRQDKVKFL